MLSNLPPPSPTKHHKFRWPARLAAALSIIAAGAFVEAGDAHAKRGKAAKQKKVEVKTDGPLTIVVSLKKQRMSVYDSNGIVAQTRVSTGKAGYRTPKGVFSVIQKRRRHYSNLYASAPMPNMQRITWSGVAMHAGHVPRYPASHGCIRLPYSFSKKLFSMTNMGTRVIVSDNLPAQNRIQHANLLRPLPPGQPELIEGPVEVDRDYGERAENHHQPNGTPTLIGVTPAQAAGTSDANSAAPISKTQKTRASVTASYTRRIDRLSEQVEQAKVWRKQTAESLKTANLAVKKNRIAAAKARKRAARLKAATRKTQKQVEWLENKLDATIRYFEKRPPRGKAAVRAEKRKNDLADQLDAKRYKAQRLRMDARTAKASIPAINADADAAVTAAKRLRKNYTMSTATTSMLSQSLKKAKKAFERRNRPITVFVSKKKQRLYVRQGYDPVLQAPATVTSPDTPIGTHVYTAVSYTADQMNLEWRAITAARKRIKQKYAAKRKACRKKYWRRSKRKARSACLRRVEKIAAKDVAPTLRQTPENALDRIEISTEIRDRLAEMMTPGSSLIISDEGVGNETGKYTDIIVLTRS